MDLKQVSGKQALWERKLLDFSLRNNLLNTKLGKRTIPFVSFDLENIENNLQSASDYSLSPFPKTKQEPAQEGMYNSSLQSADLKDTVIESVKQNKLISYQTETELSQSVKYIYRTSRTALEENGANSLFLALGLVKWYEKGSLAKANPETETARFAPVLLLPVNLIRKKGQGGYVIRKRDEEIILNISFAEFLKQQFGIDITFLNPLPTDDKGADVRKVFDAVKQAIAPMQGWNVIEECVLSLFSFSKFVMWNDIHCNQTKLRENKIIASLIENRIQTDNTGNKTDIKQIDKHNEPKDFAVPLDVDSSQLEAVIESANNKSFILYGPPGTGKSQTITNIIANALYHGKKVLFVAEKKAALDVVQKRLEKIGLGDFCLELHSNKVTKKHFLEQMQKVLDITKKKSPEEYAELSKSIYEKRKLLINYNESLFEKDENGFSLYELINNYLAITEKEYEKEIYGIQNVTKDEISLWQNEISKLEVIENINGNIYSNPLKGLIPKNNEQSTFNTIKTILHNYIEQKDKDLLTEELNKLSAYCDINAIDGSKYAVDNVQTLITEHGNYTNLYNQVCRNHGIRIDGLDVTLWQNRWKEANNKNFIAKIFARNKVYKELKQYGFWSKSEIDSVLQLCANYKQAEKLWKENLEDKYSFLESLKQQFSLWLENFNNINDWWQWADKKNEYSSSLFKYALQQIEEENISSKTAINSFIKGIYRSLITDKINKSSQLRSFNGLLFDQTVQKYRQDTKEFQELTKQELFAKLASNIPSQTTAAAASSQMGILKRNIMNSGRGNSIRNIIDKIPNLLTELTPCMLMSPISVAQFLSLNGESGENKNISFDLVIFDEASQMPTSEAIGAIARGKNLIVVGDPKQMPPTSFFTTTQTDDEDADIDDMESILDDCISLSMPEYYLSWHYRSKHESLIAFSNSQYYDNRLYTFPSVDDNSAKVRLMEVKGTYDKGKTRSNTDEANAIVEEVIRRLSDANLQKQSIGIVSFSKVQQNLIEDLLENELKLHPELEERAYNSAEPVFIKNLENVQGDERDVILFSVGYGPDKEGNVSMNFGPLNNTGGERRLNVAVSRARYEMIVFSSLKPEQIDLNRTAAKGVEGLKRFLEFAAMGNIYGTSKNNDTLLSNTVVKQIADELVRLGYNVKTNVGRSKFKIDIAVFDKNNTDKYILGIICDSAVRNSVPTVRDREIVQPNVLTMLQWNLYRVWILDWINNRQQIINAITEKLSALS